jgi:ribulose-5-phosphate 4-epimerase/fuculose-1-phosphate aldolase
VVALDNIDKLREKVALSCRMIGRLGLSKGSYGHVSARIPQTDRVLIKAKGPRDVGLEFASKDDVIMIDLAGKVLEAPEGLDPPGETVMHLEVYKARPEIMSVIHSHPDWIVILTACDKPLLPIYTGYNPTSIRMFMEGIPLYPRSVTIVNESLSRDFVKVMGDKKACMLRGHGLTTAGTSVEESTRISMNLFELARMNYLAYALGNPLPVPQEDIDEHQERWERGMKKRQGKPPVDKEMSEWLYYKRLIEK